MTLASSRKAFLASALLLALSTLHFPLSTPAFASGPSSNRVLNYQLRLTSSAGVPVADGNQNIKLTFYTASSGGTQLYTACSADGTATGTPTAVVAAFVSGQSSILIGSTLTCASGSSPAIPATLFDNTSIFLGVTVSSDSEMTPRKRIVAAGYALNADKLDDLETSAVGGSNAFVPVTDSSGNFTLTKDVLVDTTTFKVDSTNNRVGVGTASPGSPFVVSDGSSGAYNFRFLADGGGGETRTILNLTTDSGPAVNGYLQCLPSSFGAIRNSTCSFDTDAANGMNIGTLSASPITFYTGGDLAGFERMTISSAGSVGIGDMTPDALLDVAGTFQFDGNGVFGDASGDSLTFNASTASVPSGLELQRSLSGGQVMLKLSDTSTSGYTLFTDDTSDGSTFEPSMVFNQAGGGGVRAGVIFNSILSEDGADDTVFRFYAQETGNTSLEAANLLQLEEAPGTIRWSIDHAGNMAIGSSAPQETLHVQGTGRFDSKLEIGANTGSSALLSVVRATDGDVFEITDNSSHNLVVSRTGSTISLGPTTATTIMALRTNNTTRATIDASGNVGIGTSGPSALLEVRKDQNASTVQKLTNATSGSSASAYLQFSSGTTNSYFGSYSQGFTDNTAFTNFGTLENTAASGGLLFTASDATGIIKMMTGGSFAANERLRITAAGNVGIGDDTPASLLTVGSGDRFNVNSSGDVTSTFTTLNGSNTANGAGSNSTTLILNSATNFDVGNYVQVAATACVANPCFAKITAISTNTLTISPALSWSNADTVTEVHVPEIGGVDLTQALANRYGRGYFIDGIVTGNGSTRFSDNLIDTTANTLNFNTTTNRPVTFGTGTVTMNGSLSVTGTITSGGAAAYVNGGNSFGAAAILGTNDANSLSLETNNVTYFTIASGGGFTLPVDTDWTLTGGVNGLSFDGTTFSVDATNNRIGINTAAPGNPLDVVNPATNGPVTLKAKYITGGSASQQTVATIITDSIGDMTDGFGPFIEFKEEDDANVENQLGLVGFTRDGGDNNGKFRVFVDNGGAPRTDAFAISYGDANGPLVGVGTAAPDTIFNVEASSIITEPFVHINNTNSGDSALQFSIVGDAYAMGIDNSDADKFKISYASTAGAAVLGTNDRLSIDAAGLVRVYGDLGVSDLASVVDQNGNKVLVFGGNASAVNQVTVANASTGGNPAITATGTDTNIGLDINTKGTFGLFLNNNVNAAVSIAAGGGETNIAGGYGSSGCTIDSAGGLSCNGGSTIDATATFNGDVTMPVGAAGTITLGNSSSDSVIFTARAASDLVPQSDNTYDLGTTSQRWKTLHVGPGSIVVHNDTSNTNKIVLDFSSTVPRIAATSSASLELSSSNGTVALAASNNFSIPSGNLNMGGSTTLTSGRALQNITGYAQSSGTFDFASALTTSLANSTNAWNIDSNTLVVDALNNRVGIGDSTPASLFTVGNGDLFNVNSTGDVTSAFTTLNGSNTANGAGSNSTTLILNSATNFDVGNYVQVAATACVTNPCFAKITNIATNTLTISPALSWSNADTVTEVHVPEIGGVDLTQALANRYGRGYFIDGIVTGNGSTYFSDGKIESAGGFTINATSGQAVTFGGSLTVTGAISSSSTGNSVFNGPLALANLSSDPSGTNGLTYYNSSSNKFRCYQGGAWTDCIGSGGGTLQAAYNGSTSPELTLDATRGALTIRDASSPIGANLLEIQNNAGSSTYLALTSSALSVGVDVLPSSAPTSGSASRTTTNVAAGIGSVGAGTDVVVASDTYPVIAFYDQSNGDLRVAKCSSTTCSSGVTYTTVDSTGTVGGDPHIALSGDGFPVISYYDSTNQDLKVVKCGNASCSSGNTITTVDSTGSVGAHNDIALDAGDGFPVISYYDQTNDDLKVLKCGNASCSSSNTITTVDSTGGVGQYNSIAVPASGTPVISYLDGTNTALKVTKCGNASCSSSNTLTTVDNTGNMGWYSSIAIGTDGFPVVSYVEGGATQWLRVADCGNASCSASTTLSTVDNSGFVIGPTSIAVRSDGQPVIAYGNRDMGPTDYLQLGRCANTTCTSLTTSVSLPATGSANAVAISNDGFPFVSYYDSVPGNLEVTKCADAGCVTGPTHTILQSYSNPYGDYSDAVTPADGLPVVSYYDSVNGNLIVTKCGNATCSSGNTTTTVDSAANDVGRYTSIAISSDGFPVISYYDNTGGDLKVTKCGNAACSSGNTTTTVETTNNIGLYTSIAVPSDGFPVISYYDNTNFDLRVMKCGNASCSSGNSSTSPETSGIIGLYTAIAIGADGFPIISYYYSTSADLYVYHCANAACTSGARVFADSTITGGTDSSITVPDDGLPVISYSAGTAGLKVIKCGNTSCSTGTTTAVDSTTSAGTYTSITVPTSGTPVISYISSNTLKVAKCGNASCSTATITTVDSSGTDSYTATVLVSGSYPLVFYHDSTTSGAPGLKAVACVDGACEKPSTTSYTGGKSIGSTSNYFTNVYASTFWGKNYRIENFDLAESYRVRDTSISAGDIVRISGVQGTSEPVVEKTSKAYDTGAVGIISTQPGLLLTQWDPADDSRPVALSGRVPVKVNGQGGPIAPGDAIAPSSEAGVGMKATKPGRIVGYALSSLEGMSGTVEVFVNPGYYAGAGTDLDLSAKDEATDTVSSDSYGLSFTGSAWDAEQAAAVSRGFSLANVVTAKDAYRLSLKNEKGDELAYFGQDGDVALKGRMFLGDSGTLQANRYLTLDATSGLAGDRIKTNASGWGATGHGFADTFASNDALEPGEFVMLDVSDAAKVKRAEKSDAASTLLAVGVVADRPGYLAGMDETPTFPVVMAGSVTARIVGPVEIGDPIAMSATPGVGTKADGDTYIAGIALQKHEGTGPGTVTMVVKSGWFNGGEVQQPNTTVSQTPASPALGAMSSNLDMAGYAVTSVGAISGINGLWSIDGDGNMLTKGTVASSVATDNGNVTVYATGSQKAEITLSGTGQLVNGAAAIVFDDVFQHIISGGTPIKVTVTLTADAQGVYVTDKTIHGFTVRELNGGTSNATFDWMVIARRKGFDDPTAAEPATEPAQPPAPPVQDPVSDTSEAVTGGETTVSPESAAPTAGAGDETAPEDPSDASSTDALVTPVDSSTPSQ